MRKISALLLFQLAGTCWGQLATGYTTSNGVTISYETKLEPSTPGITKTGNGTLTENNVIKRQICDFAQKTYFGYDLTAEKLADGRYQLRFSALSIPPAQMAKLFPIAGGWTLLPLPQIPVTQTLNPGDMVALDLFVNPATGQKIVEYIKVPSGEIRNLTAPGTARNFSPEDGWLELSAPRLTINGNVDSATSHFRGGVAGSPLWMYLAGRGRFIFSLAPHSNLGFHKAGEVRGSTLTWRWGGDEYSLNNDKRIAPGDGAFTIYVFNDTSYRPKGGDSFELGAGGTLESLLKR